MVEVELFCAVRYYVKLKGLILLNITSAYRLLSFVYPDGIYNKIKTTFLTFYLWAKRDCLQIRFSHLLLYKTRLCAEYIRSDCVKKHNFSRSILSTPIPSKSRCVSVFLSIVNKSMVILCGDFCTFMSKTFHPVLPSLMQFSVLLVFVSPYSEVPISSIAGPVEVPFFESFLSELRTLLKFISDTVYVTAALNVWAIYIIWFS